jgi:hypothetical protein
LAAQPPRDLTSLLVEIRVPDDIDRCPWAKLFRDYLVSLKQPEKEAMLDFVIVCNVLRTKESEVKQISRGMKWRLTELNKERRDLLIMVGASFFCEHSDTPIALTNQVLREDLSKKLDKVSGVSDDDLTEVFDLVWQARCDHRVWKGGLDTSYNQFIATKPAPSLTAVLLSIM